jgi:hypothetical protein
MFDFGTRLGQPRLISCFDSCVQTTVLICNLTHGDIAGMSPKQVGGKRVRDDAHQPTAAKRKKNEGKMSLTQLNVCPDNWKGCVWGAKCKFTGGATKTTYACRHCSAHYHHLCASVNSLASEEVSNWCGKCNMHKQLPITPQKKQSSIPRRERAVDSSSDSDTARIPKSSRSPRANMSSSRESHASSDSDERAVNASRISRTKPDGTQKSSTEMVEKSGLIIEVSY